VGQACPGSKLVSVHVTPCGFRVTLLAA
jgi:hypothetical protein